MFMIPHCLIQEDRENPFASPARDHRTRFLIPSKEGLGPVVEGVQRRHCTPFATRGTNDRMSLGLAQKLRSG